jgi:hypothetical protein
MTQEAMKQALEALEGFIPYLPLKDEAQCNRYDNAITSLRQAIREHAMREVQRLGQEIEQCTYPNCDYHCMNLPDCKERKQKNT